MSGDAVAARIVDIEDCRSQAPETPLRLPRGGRRWIFLDRRKFRRRVRRPVVPQRFGVECGCSEVGERTVVRVVRLSLTPNTFAMSHRCNSNVTRICQRVMRISSGGVAGDGVES